METDRYQRVKEVFGAVVDAPLDRRSAMLHEQCGDDATLLREVQTLLKHVDSPRINIEQAAAAAQATLSSLAVHSRRRAMLGALAKPGDRIGGYRILGVLGEGGMGIVYLAEQERPRRTVALKVVKPGSLSSSMLRRFEHEAHVLGRLQHPGIAQIFEAGTAETPAGTQPYFAMEYVKGQPLLEHINTRALGTRQRLMLLIRICDAVHHAHLQGVIHRDLKPANILVVEDGSEASRHQGIEDKSAAVAPIPRSVDASVPQPKILDFGIARSTDADIHTTTLRTDIGQLIGTIPYMSPEQVAGDPTALDARSDIYALGVIGYELLAGRLPHDLRGKTIPEAVRIIGEGEHTPLSSINRYFRGDLDTIISKALERQPQRRYGTAAELAADIQRYLDDHPIVARPPTVMYQLAKFARRNRAAVTALAAVFIMLIASIVAVSIYAVNATMARDEARTLQQSESAARELATSNAQRLAQQLTISTIERGRLQGLAGNIGQAEDLLWPEHLSGANTRLTHWALWELYAREPCKMTRRVHDGVVNAVRHSPDGARIFTAGEDGRVCIWNSEPFEILHDIIAHTGPVRGLAISDDGFTFASVGDDARAFLWNVSTGELVRELPKQSRGLRSVAFAPDQQVLAVGGIDGVIRLWNIDTGDLVRELTGHRGSINALRFDRAGRMLYAASADGRLGCWDAQSDDAEPTLIDAHGGIVHHLAISRDETMIATGGNDHHVHLWDVRTRERLATLRSPNGSVQFVEFSPDDRTLYVGGWWHVDRWDVATRRRLDPLSISSTAICGSIRADGRSLLAGFAEGIVREWETSDHRGEIRLGDHVERVAAAFSPDGSTLATGDNAGTVRLWDARTGAMLRTIEAHADRIRPIAYHPTEPLLLTGGLDHILRVWNLDTGELEREITGHNAGSGGAINFSPDGRLLVYCRRGGTSALVTWPELEEIHVFKTSGAEALSVQFSPDARMIAFTGRQEFAALFSVETGERITLLATPSMVWDTTFAPDGRSLYGGSWTRQILKWDVQDGTFLPVEFAGHNGLVSDVAMRPGDPDMLASASTDGTVKLWDTRSGLCLATLVGFDGWEAINVAFSPDGRHLAATGSNGEAVIWNLHHYDSFIEGNRAIQGERVMNRTP